MYKFLYHLAILIPLIVVTFDIAVAHTVQLPIVRKLPPPPHGDNTGWQLIFQDEFDYPQVVDSKWARCYWWGIQGCTIASNGELEWYLPANVSVEQGILKLQARREQTITPSGAIYDYTSGMVTTGRDTSDRTIPPRFAFQYGYAEIRAKVPKGQGLWSAFWLLPEEHRSIPEIDVLEILGQTPDKIYMFLHYENDEGEDEARGDSFQGPDFSADWHTFAIDWSPEALIWYVDGKEYRRVKDTKIIPATPMYLILNLAVGGDWPGGPDEQTPFPSNFEIDYVRVWSRHTTTELTATEVVVPAMPVADTIHADAAAPHQRIDEATRLTTADAPTPITYLEFDTSSLAGQTIDSATLRLGTSGKEGAQLQGAHSVFLMETFEDGQSFELGEFTFSNRPQLAAPPIGRFDNGRTDEIHDITLDIRQLQPQIGQHIVLALVSQTGEALNVYADAGSKHHIRLSITSLRSTQHTD